MMMRAVRSVTRRFRLMPVLLCLVVPAACANAEPMDLERTMHVRTSLRDVSEVEWHALASRRIYFGHQSVGRDIMAGVRRVLQDNRHIPLRVVSADDPQQVEGPAFVEGRIGRNRLPETKSDAFAAVLAGGFGAETNAVAMYKYCYVDVLADTDEEELFRDYVARTDALRAQYPGLTIVHFTLPLHTAPGGILEPLRTMLGMPTQTRLNIKRNRYNELLREHYAGRQPMFDIALIESTRPGGQRAYSRYAGAKVYMLAPEWTRDGGHLTPEAQYRVAEQLLVFLARLKVDATTGSVAGMAPSGS
jgi:hypothetical protein